MEPRSQQHHALIRPHHREDLCVVAPAPELKDQLKEQFDKLREQAPHLLANHLGLQPPIHVGFNDGLIYPGTYYPTGTGAAVARRAALERAPLRGTVRVAVVLVEFPDRALPADAVTRFEQLFFSTGELTHGSVAEYFADVSGGLISIEGEVVGPYELPQNLTAYAGADNGTQRTFPNARTLANDALSASDADLDFAPYDNDGNGFVDAYIVVHAGRGAEQTGGATDIWSHKWVLPTERTVDGVKVFAYLTIPEDANIGVAAHEIGHLVFGWPDLYDTDQSSEGIGNWCLMAGGSWGLGGERPTHPSAWCKANQGWISVVAQSSNGTVTVEDVKDGRTAYRLWTNGRGGNEYFLVENRQASGYDASLPGSGLLVWHIDDAVEENTNEAHFKVGLEQADGQRHLEVSANRGDAGDPFPGSSGSTSFTSSSTPNSRSYAGSDTCVSITGIPASSASMTVNLSVTCGTLPKPFREGKIRKELVKELRKEFREKDLKEFKEKDTKELKEKDTKEFKEKEFKEFKEKDKEIREKLGEKFTERPPIPFGAQGYDAGPQTGSGDVQSRLAQLEATLHALVSALTTEQGQGAGYGQGGEPFIGSAERPDLHHGAGGPDLGNLQQRMAEGSAGAKAEYDSLPPQ